MNEYFATIKAEPKRVMILEPNPDFSPWLIVWPDLVRPRGGLTLGSEDYIQKADRFARHIEATIPNPLYMELFE